MDKEIEMFRYSANDINIYPISEGGIIMMKIGTIVRAIETAMLDNFSAVTNQKAGTDTKGYSVHYKIPGTESSSDAIHVVFDSTGYVVYWGWPDKGVQVFSGSIDGKRIDTFDPKVLEDHFRDTWAEQVSPYYVEFFRDVHTNISKNLDTSFGL